MTKKKPNYNLAIIVEAGIASVMGLTIGHVFFANSKKEKEVHR
jgi:hypothetical protein